MHGVDIHGHRLYEMSQLAVCGVEGHIHLPSLPWSHSILCVFWHGASASADGLKDKQRCLTRVFKPETVGLLRALALGNISKGKAWLIKPDVCLTQRVGDGGVGRDLV